ncbi:MAG: thioredoxin domain-containing protein [Patescibacteria group bacterium]
MEQKQNSLVTIPGAIIVAGAIIAMAIIWTQKPMNQVARTTSDTQVATVVMADITANDHILGNPNAPIKIVEYSDSSCPFCKMFHPTMVKVMAEYGDSGKVAWVYRHFPLDKPGTRPDGGILHPNAGTEAQAMECAAALGGNDAFWKYTNTLYDVTPAVTSQAPNGLDPSKLPEIAQSIGLDVISFNECLTSKRFTDKIESQYQDGLGAGVTGTPYSIIITPSGSKIPLTGAVPYSTLKTSIDGLIAEIR